MHRPCRGVAEALAAPIAWTGRHRYTTCTKPDLTLRNRGFESRREGALQAYLRRPCEQHPRRLGRAASPAGEQLTMRSRERRTPLELAIGRENAERYDAAVAALVPADREAIVGRIELGYDYDELAAALEKPSPGAARIAVRRALVRLATKMKDLRDAR